MYEIIVAHHNEDLLWLRRFPKESVHVYSKGEDAKIPCIRHRLPNVGREAHTYLTYIIDRYDTLPDIVFFTQGWPHDHIHCHVKEYLNITDYSHTAASAPFVQGLNQDCHIRHYKNCDLLMCAQNGYDWVHEYIDPTIDFSNNLFIFWGAILSVNKEFVLSRPREYYNRLLDIVSTHKDHEEVHFLERSWYYIFQL